MRESEALLPRVRGVDWVCTSLPSDCDTQRYERHQPENGEVDVGRVAIEGCERELAVWQVGGVLLAVLWFFEFALKLFEFIFKLFSVFESGQKHASSRHGVPEIAFLVVTVEGFSRLKVLSFQKNALRLRAR